MALQLGGDCTLRLGGWWGHCFTGKPGVQPEITGGGRDISYKSWQVPVGTRGSQCLAVFMDIVDSTYKQS